MVQAEMLGHVARVAHVPADGAGESVEIDLGEVDLGVAHGLVGRHLRQGDDFELARCSDWISTGAPISRLSGMPINPRRLRTPLRPLRTACQTLSRFPPREVIMPMPVMTIGSSLIVLRVALRTRSGQLLEAKGTCGADFVPSVKSRGAQPNGVPCAATDLPS